MKPVVMLLIGCVASVYLASAVLVTYLLFLIRASVPLEVIALFCHVLLLGLSPVLFGWFVWELRTMLREMSQEILAAVTVALQGQTWEINAHMDNGLVARMLTGARADQAKAAEKLRRETAEIAATLAEADRTNREGTAGLVRDDAAVVAEAHREQTADIAQRLADAMDRERSDPVSDDEG